MKNTKKKLKAKTSLSPNGSNPKSEVALVVSEAARPRRFSQDFSAGGKTQQHFKDSCDVNNIVAHYTQTGIDPHADRIGKQIFGFATSRSFEEAMQATAEVRSAFALLPSAERSHFSNDPSAWLDHVLTVSPDPEPETPPETPPNVSTPPTPTPDTPEKGSETP